VSTPFDQPSALFEIQPDGRFMPAEIARGPWSPDALHGGPVAALVVGAAEGFEADRSNPMRVVRLTLELTRPVPQQPLTLTLRTIRRGRKVQLVQVTVSAGARDVATALVLRARERAVDLPAVDPPVGPSGRPMPPEQAAGQPHDGSWPAFHNSGMELRYASGAWLQPGPAVVWCRLRTPVVTGWPVTPAMRAAAAADFGNGVSMVIPFETFTFVNPDLTVYLDRPPVGEWICLDAATSVHPESGLAVAHSVLHDETGPVGRGMQSLLLEPR
jgi:hypothetical protein